MFKVKYITCLIVLIFMPLCFSDSEVTLSLKTKTLISDILSDFMAEAQIKKEVKRDEDKQTKKKKPHQHLTELKKWQFVFKPEHNTYVKELLKSKEFSLWVWQGFGNYFLLRFIPEIQRWSSFYPKKKEQSNDL